MSLPYDLNLLGALEVLIEERGVTAAARRMKTSIPTMSRTLATIRDVLNDQILVVAGRLMVPTPYALEVLPRVQAILTASAALYHAKSVPDLKALRRVFSIRAVDVVVGTMASAIAAELNSACPDCSLRFMPEAEGDDDSDRLRTGEIDLYIGATEELRPEIRRQALFSTAFEGLARLNHPIFEAPITPQSIVSWDHLNVSRRGRKRGPIDDVLEDNFGLERRIRLVVPSFYTAIQAVYCSDFILPLPDIVVNSLLLHSDRFRSFKFPFPLDKVRIVQAWHPRFDSDPLHKWLREMVAAVVRRMTGDRPTNPTLQEISYQNASAKAASSSPAL